MKKPIVSPQKLAERLLHRHLGWPIVYGDAVDSYRVDRDALKAAVVRLIKKERKR